MASATFLKPAVRADHVVALAAVLARGVVAGVVDPRMMVSNFAVDLIERRGRVLGVLAHLETGRRDAARVRRLARHERHAVLDEVLGRLRRGGHVGALADDLAPVITSARASSSQQGVLARAGQRDIAQALPDARRRPHAKPPCRSPRHTCRGAHFAIVAGALLVVDILRILPNRCPHGPRSQPLVSEAAMTLPPSWATFWMA